MKCTMESRLLALLKKQWVTPIDALNKVGCMSLAQRVSVFIRSGMKISKRWVDLPNGKRVRSYRLG